MITEAQLLSRARQRREPATSAGFALWGTGFRPFFLLSAAAAVALVPWWVLGLMGRVPVGAGVGGAAWHAHEMLLGFAAGVVAGFLLTAVPKWTETEAASGGVLKVLAALWLAGRLVMGAAAWLPATVVAAVDLAFLPALVVAVGRPILATRNRRNLIFPGMLAVMTSLNLAYHLQAVGVAGGSAMPAMRGVMGLVVIMMVIIGGRIIPMFTRNGLARAGIAFQPRATGWIDKAAMLSAGAVALLELGGSPAALGAGCLIAGALNAGRMVGWGGLRTACVPLLWILHLGYGWIALGLCLRGWALLAPGAIPPTAALHALTAGAMGSLILGMISRVSLGHTGRPLEAGRAVTLSFILIAACGGVRVLLPILAPQLWLATHQVSAALWAGAFSLFLWVYTPWLLRPRPDGVPG